MPVSEYENTVNWLFNQFPSYQFIGSSAYKPTLDNTIAISRLTGTPEKDLRFIHVAGTNGKGSVSAMLASILTEAGEKVGLFTSPHIVDFRERIRINGEMIPEEEVVEFCKRIRSEELNFDPSFFEVTFIMALEHFRKNKCTVCVIETGLGGRLDATNIITPLISVITTIGLEHTQLLGNTLDKIATEKAGIIKKGIPVVIGEYKEETSKVFDAIAEEKTAPIHYAAREISREKVESFELPLLGDYQKQNLCSVLTTLLHLKQDFATINDTIINKGLKNIHQNTGFFGRLQIVAREPLTIFDVSHNADGIRSSLKEVVRMNKGTLYILYGSSSDKDVVPFMELFPDDSRILLTTFRNPRSMRFDQVEELAKNRKNIAGVYDDSQRAFEQAQVFASKEDTILVTGSFFLLSDFFRYFSVK